ncbi:TIGR02285 family protein [Roseateles sp. DAIF2]|uniref:TIGR02285 family protein n=1 Tax=Roseateles sp. DAIF2 TaxID=2714952 RepID=UPI0018A2C249|nr:TIGR02285 family protein [Roseateles sp. DAIF2]QPF76251.1 TIGR02285 family protein [Roseateles sp. DAIF2]
MLLGLAALAAVARAQEPAPPPLLRWVVQDMPPHFSYATGRVPTRPEDLGQGEVDGFLRLLIQRMPEYRHEFVEASTPRFEALSRQGQTLCSVLHVRRPERLEWAYFTQLHPALAARQIHVVVHRDSLARFESGGQALQLAELLQRPDLAGLLPRERSFGPRIDALLQQAPAANQPRTIAVSRNTQLLAMLRAKRMDYTLEYPAVVDEFQRSLSGPPELVKLPLAEGRSTQVATAACSRTPEGRRQIEAIDQAVRQLAADPQRERWIRAWRGEAADEGERQRLLRYLDERGRGGPLVE